MYTAAKMKIKDFMIVSKSNALKIIISRQCMARE
jgi:hypothetical protein